MHSITSVLRRAGVGTVLLGLVVGITEVPSAAAFSGAPPPLTARFLPGTSAPDPLVAAGHNFVLTSDTSNIEFFTKPSAKHSAQPVPLPGATVDENGVPHPKMSMDHFFRNLLQKANTDGSLPDGACGDKSQLPYVKTNPEDLAPDNIGCLHDVYDTRIQFDPVRNRFWIIASVRNLLWACEAAPTVGLLPGVSTDTDRVDGQLGPDGKAICHPDGTDGWHRSYMRRLFAVAVSDTEDPTQGFHKFILNANDYEDWPQFALQDHYLILNHNDTPSKGGGCACVFVFNAYQLANPGTLDDSVLTISPLATFTYAQITTEVIPSRPVWLVTQHSGRRDVTFLWTVLADGKTILVRTLFSPHPDDASDPPLNIGGMTFTMGSVVGWPPDNAAYQGSDDGVGDIAFASDRCTWTNFTNKACKQHTMEVYDLPVVAIGTPPTLHAGFSAHLGATHVVVSSDANTADGVLSSYSEPAAEMTTQKDIVVVYQRTGLFLTEFTGTDSPPPSARYLVWRHGQTSVSEGGTLLTGLATISTAPKVYPDPDIDLGGAALDPDGTTVWMSHAATKANGHWAQVVGATSPSGPLPQ